MRKLVTSSTVPLVSEQENQPLSLVLMCLNATRGHASPGQPARDSRSTVPNGTIPRPGDLAGVISKTQFFGAFSLIHGGTVQKVTCGIEGDTASGLVHLEIERTFSVRVEYQAAKVNGKFRLGGTATGE